jgi:hypothetical protein
LLALESRALLTNFYVTNLNDMGAGSLMQAIIDVNADPDPYPGQEDSISFQLTNPPADPTINLQFSLPAITRQQVIISGGSPGVPVGTDGERGATGVILNGVGGGDAFDLQGGLDTVNGFVINNFGNGVYINSNADTVEGCTIESNGGSGVDVSGATGAYIESNVIVGNDFGVVLGGSGADDNALVGNYIGIAGDGGTAFGNKSSGVYIYGGASDNAVQQNVISGNANAGVFISGTGTRKNNIADNLIGTDAAGISAVPNQNRGVFIGGGAIDNTVQDRNIISGNDGDGIDIEEPNEGGNSIAGNYIGVNVYGTAPVSNTGSGIAISDFSSNDAISDNVISGNDGDGIDISQGSPSISVQGNLIGVDSYGTLAIGNSDWGVIVDQSPSATVGGTAAGAGNVISGNGQGGLAIYGGVSDFDLVEGNYIGTDITGTVALGNGYSGVYIGSGSLFSDDPEGSAAFVTIGGTAAGASNLISGNDTDYTGNGGIVVYGSGADDNVIEGNYIGVDIAGNVALANQGVGVDIFGGAAGNTVGGTSVATANLISGNNGDGADVQDTGTTGNVVLGNLIGTDITGSYPLGNSGAGVGIYGGASSNTIGGVGGDSANVISGNSGQGVDIDSAKDNVVLGNLIGTDITGSYGVGNSGGAGVYVADGATGNTIGGGSSGSGNLISGNGVDGIKIVSSDTTGNVFLGNLIGTDITGSYAIGNSYNGVEILGASDNTIGGTSPGDGNVISASEFYGISLGDTGTDDNLIVGNLVGTDITGTSALGNGFGGVALDSGASNNTIGGMSSGSEDVISGNDGSGVIISNSGTTGNLVIGNEIGTDVTGSVALGNNYQGILIDGGATDNTIGGIVAGSANVISGNNGDGVDIQDQSTTGNVVLGNLIGTDITGSFAVANTGNGVSTPYGASDDTIGGTQAGAGNVISGNGASGIYLTGSEVSGDLIAGNLIGTGVKGTTAIGNAFWGVILDDTSGSNTVGGSTFATGGNLISGNNQGGVAIYGSTEGDDLVEGNLIGTDITGANPLGNAYSGVYVGDFGNNTGSASGATIGGTTAGSGNVVSDNGNYGIWLQDGAKCVLVAGNFVGTNASGSAAIGNAETGVEIDGGSFDNTIGGTTPSAANVIAGNGTLQSFYFNVGILGAGTSNNLVEGNDIGTNASNAAGLNPADSLGIGMGEGATDNTIGGTVSGSRNIISGNSTFGIEINGAGSTGNVIEGDYIGVDSTGEHGLDNGWIGVLVVSATDNTIGGTSAAARNIISGNGFGSGGSYPGVELNGAGATGNVVEGNYIGTDMAGTVAIGNYGSGVAIEDGADGNTIGGTVPGSGNLISGNGYTAALNPAYGFGSGVNLFGDGGTVTGNVVEGNLIGTDVTGTKPLGNLFNGISIIDGASDNTIGGTSASTANIIAFNKANGVQVGTSVTDESVGNAILGNSIFGNIDLGINLGNQSAPTGHATGNLASGPNLLQNAPVLTSAITDGSSTTVTGTMTATANTTFRIEFFSNPAGMSQGDTYLGYATVVTNGSGIASFSFSTGAALAAGLNITGTATDSGGNTSEFSVAASVSNLSNDLSTTYSGFTYNRTTRQFTQTVTIKNIGTTPLVGPIELVLVNLKNATLSNASGTYEGSPYITLLGNGVTLGVGQSFTITLIFNDPTLAAIGYTSQLLLGPVPPPAS